MTTINLWDVAVNKMHYVWCFYWDESMLPVMSKICDVAILIKPNEEKWNTYLYTWTCWIPLTSFWTDNNLNNQIPTKVVWKWKEYNRMPTEEEVDQAASTMIKDLCLKYKHDQEALHVECDDVIKIVLQSLWLNKTLEAYNEASKKFRYS